MIPNADDRRAEALKLAPDYQARLTQQHFEQLIDLWAEDGVLEFPFAPPGRRSRYVGKPDILACTKQAIGKFAVASIEQTRMSSRLDPGKLVVESSVKGRVLANDASYSQSLAIFFEVRDGNFRSHREYSIPLITIDTIGGRDKWTAGFGFPEERGA